MAGETTPGGVYNEISDGKVLNKQGLLELSSQIKGYINTNMPQSYTLPTASTSTLGGVKVDGETITIADGVISAVGGTGSNSTILQDDLLFGTIYSTLRDNNSNIINDIGATFTRPTTRDEFIENCKKSIWFYNECGDSFTGSNFTNLKNQLGISLIKELLVGDNGIQISPTNYQYYFNPSYVYYKFVKVNQLGLLISISNIYNIKEIYKFLNPIPTVPSTDGSYMLKCVVSSGTPTYSWEEITVGGSY